MSLLPSSTNGAYGGSRISIAVLTVTVLGTIVPSLIHTFLPDGGANRIAGLGLDLESEHGRQVVSLFAWAGATQMVWGLMLLAVLLRYRSFVPLALGLLTLERVVHAWNMWSPKGGDYHPPEAWITLALVPILAAAFALSLRSREAS